MKLKVKTLQFHCSYFSFYKCFSFVENDSNGSLQVSNVSSIEKKCEEAQRIAANNLLSTTHTISF